MKIYNWFFMKESGTTREIRSHRNSKTFYLKSLQVRDTGKYICYGVKNDSRKYISLAMVIIMGKYSLTKFLHHHNFYCYFSYGRKQFT